MKAVIFDMDGVIIDSEPIYEYSKNGVLAAKSPEMKFIGFIEK